MLTLGPTGPTGPANFNPAILAGPVGSSGPTGSTGPSRPSASMTGATGPIGPNVPTHDWAMVEACCSLEPKKFILKSDYGNSYAKEIFGTVVDLRPWIAKLNVIEIGMGVFVVDERTKALCRVPGTLSFEDPQRVQLTGPNGVVKSWPNDLINEPNDDVAVGPTGPADGLTGPNVGAAAARNDNAPHALHLKLGSVDSAFAHLKAKRLGKGIAEGVSEARRSTLDISDTKATDQPSRRHTAFLRLASRYVIPAAAKVVGKRFVFDIETNGLLETVTRIHCIVVADLDSDRVDEFGPDQIDAGLTRLSEANVLIGHNIVGFDLPVLHRIHGWMPAPTVTVIDTLIASRLVLANIGNLDDQAFAQKDPKLGKLRGSHSLKAWGARFGTPKVGDDIEVWSEWAPEMQERCVGDVRLTKALCQFLQPGGQPAEALALEHRVASICETITADGIPFDREAGEQLREQWTARRKELELRLKQQFPQVTNLNSRQQIARLLEERGWVSEARTEKTRQPKIDDETLEDIVQQYPEFDGLAGHYIIGRRLGQLATGKKAWLNHIGPDGRIHGSIIPIGTPHHRAAHFNPNIAQVPNPKKGKPLATECRSLFRTGNDWVFVTCDQAGLQDRAFAHYLAAFDGGTYARAFVGEIDTHWVSVQALGLVPAETARNKEDRFHTALREGAKSFRYGFLFGAQAKRAGIIIRDTIRNATALDPVRGSDLFRRFFGGTAHPNARTLTQVGGVAKARFEAATPGLRELRESLSRQAQQYGWLPGLDRRIPVDAPYKVLNYAVSSAEAIICKHWLIAVHDELHERFRYGWGGDVVIVAWTHDEIACCCRPTIAEQVGEILVRQAKAAGEHFKLKCTLDANFVIGPSWAGEIATDKAVTDGQTNHTPAGYPSGDNPHVTGSPASADDIDDKPTDGEAIDRDFSRAKQEQEQEEVPPRDDDWAWFGEDLPGEESPSPSAGGPRSGYHAAELSTDKPYAPIRNRLLRLGYRLAAQFAYALPGGRILYSEDRFELQSNTQPGDGRPAKTCRFWHDVNGTAYSNTGPREERIIYGWQAVIDAGPGATVHVTEGARKAQALLAKGVLATAVAYHSWNERCINALRGCHLVYHEDHDLPDANGTRAAEKLSADARTKLAPAAASFRILPARRLWEELKRGGEPPHGWDVKDWLDAGGDAGRLEAACREILVEGAKIAWLDIAKWDSEPTPELDWAVHNRVSSQQVFLFSGLGGTGKSTIWLHECVAQVLGLDWFGVVPVVGPACFVDAEDAEKIHHIRLKAIGAHYGVTLTDMARAGLHVTSWAGEDAVLAVVAKNGKIEPTPRYRQLLEMAGDIKPKMIGIASAANVFAGNENDRTQVQQFISMLTRVAMTAGGALALISHPSLTGIATESGLSGTTQWHNAVRGRAYLTTVKLAEGLPEDKTLRDLVFKKNNYGPQEESIRLRWQDGMFLPAEGTKIDPVEREKIACEVFLDLLRRFTRENRNIGEKMGPSYAPRKFAGELEAQRAWLTKADLEKAMSRLLRTGVIMNEQYGRPSRPSYRLIVK
jgi:DNA polymerase I